MRLLFLSSLLSAALASYNLTAGSSSTCVCSTVPCPVSGSNSLEIGGGTIGDYHYTMHGDQPVVTSVKISLKGSDIDHGSETTSCTQEYSRMLDDDGVKDCDAGHILAHRLGGPGNQPINIFPQDLHINRGSYKDYEDEIYYCVKGGQDVDLSWTFSYESTSHTKPYKVHYAADYKQSGGCADSAHYFDN